jgi:hypothetical protein
MTTREPLDVARRCLCLELLLQRFGLEADTDDPVAARDEVRAKWLARIPDLEVDAAILPSERALLERPVGTLTDDDLDDLHGRASGALVFLWALGRLSTRPTFASVEDIADLLAEHGLLGAGSISKAKDAAHASRLRDDAELRDAESAYARTRGKAREPSDPEKIFAGVAAFYVEWILDRALPFEDE